MNKIQALEKLNQFIERICSEDELPELLVKFEQMTDNDFSECIASNQVYHAIVGWSKPRAKRKPSTSKIQAYYKLLQIDSATEKAIGVITGTNGCVSRGARSEFIQWIPLSQTKTIDNQTFVPAWIISKNDLWDYIDKESKVNIIGG